jgi:tape measure domain-containing protein
VRKPLQAAEIAAYKMATAARALARAIGRTTKAVLKFAFAKAIAGMKGLGKASLNVAGAIGGKLMSVLKGGALAIGAVAAAGAGWGIKLAADAEQAEIAFTTMLKSGDAAKAVLAELEQFAASTPFQLDSLRDGAKQLLNAGVPADQLTDKLTILGDIAAGTGKPIGDFVKIFAKVKATGKVSLESLNQLAERGVPIYSALQKELGVSRAEMLKMISQGKVGFQQMNAAIESTATGSGVFAGGMAAQSQSVSGLFSTLKDNVGFAMRQLGQEIMEAFDFKGLMATGIEMFQSLKAGIASAKPAFMATAAVVKAAFGAVWEVVTAVFNGITSALGLTGGNFMESFMKWSAIAVWAFKSWPDIAQLAFVKLQLWLVQAGANFAHLFTGVLPALFSWFTENWSSIFLDAAAFVGVVFTNIGKNIKDAMAAIWSWIASGGTKELEFAFTPLLDGFGTAITKLPDIPERAVGQLETKLQKESDNLGKALGGSMQEEIDKNMQKLDDFRNQEVETPTIDDSTVDADQTVDDTGDTGGGDKKGFAASLDKGSAAALQTIFNAGQNQKDKQQAEATKAAKQMAADMREMKNTVKNIPVIELGVAGGVR